MAQSINTVIVLRNDLTTAWETSTYELKQGEVGVGYFERTNEDGTTTKMPIIKVGDGKTTWKNLPQAEGVFMEDQILTYNFGKHKTSNGFVNAGGAGMTTSEWLLDALSEILNPKINYPSANLKANGYTTDTGTNEIGSKIIAIKWSTEASSGSYVGNDGTGTYGSSGGTSNKTGIDTKKHFSWQVFNDKTTEESRASSGTFTLNEGITIGTVNSDTYANLSGKVTLDASSAYVPKNNVGALYEAGKIRGFDAAGTTELSFSDIAVKATGFRNSWYYVGEDYTTAIDSDFIRTKGTAMNTSTPNFNIHTSTASDTTYPDGCMRIPNNTKRIMFAVPGTFTTISGIDIDGMQLPYDGFRTEVISVKSANDYDTSYYTVFVKENANGLKPTGYTINIS